MPFHSKLAISCEWIDISCQHLIEHTKLQAGCRMHWNVAWPTFLELILAGALRHPQCRIVVSSHVSCLPFSRDGRSCSALQLSAGVQLIKSMAVNPLFGTQTEVLERKAGSDRSHSTAGFCSCMCPLLRSVLGIGESRRCDVKFTRFSTADRNPTLVSPEPWLGFRAVIENFQLSVGHDGASLCVLGLRNLLVTVISFGAGYTAAVCRKRVSAPTPPTAPSCHRSPQVDCINV
jgi:hypothetical protein